MENYFKPVRKIYKIDVNAEVISTGIFTRVCMDVDIGKPLKMEIEYMKDCMLIFLSYILWYYKYLLWVW